MALSIRLTRQAARDLRDIRAYLLPTSPRGAESVRRDVEQTIDFLAAFPGVGRATHIDGVNVLAARRFPFLVYHAVVGHDLVIIHIRHGAREMPLPDDLDL